MSDSETLVSIEKSFCVDRAKQSRAACKKCREKCLAGNLRIAKLTPSPSGSGKMKNWYHLKCIFELFSKQRLTTKRIETHKDLDGWDLLKKEDKKIIKDTIKKSESTISKKHEHKLSPQKVTPEKLKKKGKVGESSCSGSLVKEEQNKDLMFREFRHLVSSITKASSYYQKTELVKEMLTKGSDGKGFKGDVVKWCCMLLPAIEKRVYNLQTKQLIKIFSRIFNIDQEVMFENLENSDLGEMIQNFFMTNKSFKPANKSLLLIDEVDDFLKTLSHLKKEDEQLCHFQNFIEKCTFNDLKTIIRLIIHDLQFDAGPKHILKGVHPDAYPIFEIYKDIKLTLKHCLEKNDEPSALLMTPFQPMPVDLCNSIEDALQVYTNKFYAEIKYNGQRVQIHKEGGSFKCFSKNSKLILTNKFASFRSKLLIAFPGAINFILDCEFIRGKTSAKADLNDNMRLYVFDCLYFNGNSLTNRPLDERKQILLENMTEIPNWVLFPHFEQVNELKELFPIIEKVFKENHEGIIIKHTKSSYDMTHSRWLKIERDNLHLEREIKPIDLIVLGSWHGSGKKVKRVADFLLGCYDSDKDKFCTVAKVEAREKIADEMQMIEIDGNLSKVPDWLCCKKSMIPDFVAKNPRRQPLWTIGGYKFILNSDLHTADEISIKYPRVLQNKNVKTYLKPTLNELKQLAKGKSKIQNLKKIKREKTKRKLVYAEPVNIVMPPKVLKVNDIIEEVVITPKVDVVPSIFGEVMMFVQEGGDVEFECELKDFIKHGGVITEHSESATYVLHLEDSTLTQNVTCSRSARHVIVEWITDSIKNKNLQDYKPYSVRWEPLEYIEQK